MQVAAGKGRANGAAGEPPPAPPPAPAENSEPTKTPDFIPPPIADNEEERLSILRALNILDTAEEDRFSSITKLVSSVFNVPIAAVSLVDADKFGLGWMPRHPIQILSRGSCFTLFSYIFLSPTSILTSFFVPPCLWCTAAMV